MTNALVPDRFATPVVSAPNPIRLPAIERSVLPNGIRIWTLPHRALPVVSLSALIDVGTVDDPADLPGLVAIATDMLDEGAGGRDSIQLAETLADLGSTLDLGAGPDATSAQLWTMRRHLDASLRVLADVLTRPHFNDSDLTRVRELRLSRLQQLRRSAASAADRTFAAAVFGQHGYGHPGLGTSASVGRVTMDDVRAHHARHMAPSRVTIIAAGDVDHHELVAMVSDIFGTWTATVPTAGTPEMAAPPAPGPRILFVAREGAPQSELRIGHLTVPRATPDYYALVLLNAGLGGSFSGRLNQRLRQQLGYTYGARSAFDMDRLAGSFACEASVQGDKTADSVREMHALVAAVCADRPLDGEELELARGSLTRGYARSFETPRQLSGALAQLAVYGLPDDTFDNFVPSMQAVTSADVAAAAQARLDPANLTTVVVGDPQWLDSLKALGAEVEVIEVEF